MGNENTQGRMIHPKGDILKGMEDLPQNAKVQNLHGKAFESGIRATQLTPQQLADLVKHHPRATLRTLFKKKVIVPQK